MADITTYLTPRRSIERPQILAIVNFQPLLSGYSRFIDDRSLTCCFVTANSSGIAEDYWMQLVQYKHQTVCPINFHFRRMLVSVLICCSNIRSAVTIIWKWEHIGYLSSSVTDLLPRFWKLYFFYRKSYSMISRLDLIQTLMSNPLSIQTTTIDNKSSKWGNTNDGYVQFIIAK